MDRYWLGGPVVEDGRVFYLVIDGESLPTNSIPIEKDRGTLRYCEKRLKELND